MRILLVTPMPPQAEAHGAIPLVLHAQLAGLLARGHEVTLVTAATGEPDEAAALERLRGEGIDLHVAARSTGADGRWRRRASLAGGWLRGDRPWRTVWFAVAGMQQTLDRLTAERHFDVAAFEDNATGSYDVPPGLPRVLTEHEVRRPRRTARPPAAPASWPGWAFSELDWQRWPEYERSVWSRADIIQVFGARDRDGIGSLAPELLERVRVNPFGVTLPGALDARAEEPGTILFVGNFTHPPNVDAARWLAEQLMPALRAGDSGAKLVVVGAAMPAAVRALAAGDIELRPDAPRIEDELARAAVVIAPVRTGGGMRMKVLQALAAGKAVVTTPRGAEGIALATPAPLLVADDAGDTAAAVAGLLADPGARAELGTRARAYAARRHSPEAYAERLEQTYEEAARRGKRRLAER
jgi:glycosyltransferase involved in cell wall biosynthesis